MPIDEIVEVDLGISIVPVEGLWKKAGMPGFISRDLSTIRVDRAVLEDKPFLYRTTIAHEAAHAVLHKEIYSQFSYSDEAGWISLVQAIDEKEFKYLEWQAKNLAGLICVPKQALKRRVQQAYQLATQQLGARWSDGLTQKAVEHIAQYLSREFEVQPSMIRERINYDGLLPPPTAPNPPEIEA